MKNIFLLIAVLFSLFTKSQIVNITGTNPRIHYLLPVTSSDSVIAKASDGRLVIIHKNDLGISGSAGWLLAGNAIADGNFIGSTNNRSMLFKLNNISRMYFDSTGRISLFGFNNVGADNAPFFTSATLAVDGSGPGLTNMSIHAQHRININGYLSGSFYDYIMFGSWPGFGQYTPGGGTTLALGGFRSSQWTGVNLYASGVAKLQATATGIGIGVDPAANLHVLNNTDNASVQLAILESDRTTMAANDEFYISRRLSDAVGTQTEIARESYVITDITDASEDGAIDWSTALNGTLAKRMRLTSTTLAPSSDGGITLGVRNTGEWNGIELNNNTGVVWNNNDMSITGNASMFHSGANNYFFDNTIVPFAANINIGSTANQWQNVFLEEAAKIDFDNGDMTLTQAGDNLTVGGGSFVLAAGTTTIAPLKFQSGTSLTTPVAGAAEYDGTNLYFSPSTTRKRIAISNNATPTSGQLLIGNGTDYTVASLTSADGSVTFTPGAGSLDVSSTTSGYTIATVATTDATQTTIATITMPAAAYGIGFLEATVIGIKADGTAWIAGKKAVRCYDNNGTAGIGSVTDVGPATETSGGFTASWTFTVTSNTVLISVTGVVGSNVNWKVSYRYVQEVPPT